jgi:hypothetical protein
MRRNFSRGKNSARRAPEQISSDPREMLPKNSQIPDLATVEVRCKKLWDEIIAEIVAIRDEFEKFCPEKSFATENPSTKNIASERNRTTFMKRVAILMRSAQRGLLSICAREIQSEAPLTSSWEMTKRQFDPKLRAEMENFVSRMLDHSESLSSSESDKRLDHKDGSHIDQQGQADVHPDVSRTRATVETTIRFWDEELANIESIVSNLDKRHTEPNSLGHVSDRKILSWFRNRTTTMKQAIRMLTQAQEGLLFGFTAVGHLMAQLETSSAASMKLQEENLRRETMERMWFIAYECERSYGSPIPEIHGACDENSKTP